MKKWNFFFNLKFIFLKKKLSFYKNFLKNKKFISNSAFPNWVYIVKISKENLILYTKPMKKYLFFQYVKNLFIYVPVEKKI